MKTTFFYGLVIAIGSTALNYILYFAGFHNSAEKLATGQTIGLVGGLAIAVVGLVLAAKARRAETPANEPFGYGRSFLACFVTGLWAAVFGTLSHVIYLTVVNPDFSAVALQAEIAKMEAKGIPSAQIEQAEGFIRMMMGPIPQAFFSLIFGIIMWTILGLIVAAFVRRPATETGVPPAVA